MEGVPESEIDEKYRAALRELLFPASKIEELVTSQTREQKIKTIELANANVQGKEDGGLSKEQKMSLDKIKAACDRGKLVNTDHLMELQTYLNSASRSLMTAFLDANLLDVLESKLNLIMF